MSEKINLASKELKELPKPKDSNQLVAMVVPMNQITNIDGVNEYKGLTELNCRGNKVEEISKFSIDLQVFDISANPIKSIQPLMATTSLKELNISQCHNLDFSFKLSELVNLTKLNAMANKLTNIDFIDGCTSLQVLDLSNNLLVHVPSPVGRCVNLIKLNLSDNAIQHGMHTLGKLVNLVELNLAWNEITELKKSFYQLSNLTLLQLYNNKITRIHKNIVGLVSLEELDMKNNEELKTIHENIAQLPNLRKIVLNGCPKLFTLPPMKEMKALKEIQLNYGQLKTIPELPPEVTFKFHYNDITEVSCDLSKTDSLELPFNKLTKLPSLKDTTVNRINVACNKIEVLEFAGVNLLALNISYNKIKTLPTELSTLTKLRQFQCSNCGLTSFPENLLDNFKNLETFECSFNQISSLTFGQVNALSNIQHFIMQFCHLSTIPLGLETCTKLKTLDVSNNVLSTLFSNKKCTGSQFTQLTMLDLSHNNLKSVGDFVTLKSLVELNLSHNPIQNGEKLIAQINGLPKLANFVCKNIPLKKTIATLSDKVCFITERTEDFREFKVISVIKQKGPETNMKQYDMIGLDRSRYPQEPIIGSYEFIGRRASQQDSLLLGHNFFGHNQHLFCVFDGHGGDYGSCFISNEMKKSLEKVRGKQIDFELFKREVSKGIKTCNKLMEENKYTDGATSVMVCATKSHYFVANIGDSRALLVRKNGGCTKITKEVKIKKKSEIREKEKDVVNVDYMLNDPSVTCRAISVDHKPTLLSERERIRSEGHFINHQEKVNGYIAVSRAIGDVQFQSCLSCLPDFFMEQRSREDCFIVLACDGVWDQLTNEEVANIVMANQHLEVNSLAKLIVDVAYTRFSGDNISCVVFDCREPSK